jgi:hypothetical protein
MLCPTGTALPFELIDVSIVGKLGGSKHGILQAPTTRAAANVHGAKKREKGSEKNVRKYSERIIPEGLVYSPSFLNPLVYSILSLASFSLSVPNTQALSARSPGTGSTPSLSSVSL